MAPMTNTSDDLCMPSSSVRSCDTILSITPPESAPAPRAGARESSSSKKITHGRASLARWKVSRTFFSLSPIYLQRRDKTLHRSSDEGQYMLMSSGPLTLIKLRLHSVATAFATSVLPVPGGPYKRRPDLFACSEC